MKTKTFEERSYFKSIGGMLGCLLVIGIYAAISFVVMYLVSRSGVYPSGSDTM